MGLNPHAPCRRRSDCTRTECRQARRTVAWAARRKQKPTGTGTGQGGRAAASARGARRGGRVQRVHHVLNECLVDRGSSPAMVCLDCYVDGHHLTTVQVGSTCELWQRPASKPACHLRGVCPPQLRGGQMSCAQMSPPREAGVKR